MKTLLILSLVLIPASASPGVAFAGGKIAARKSTAKTPKALLRAISYQMPGMPDLSGRASSSSSSSRSLTPRVEALERVVLSLDETSRRQQAQIEFLTAELKRQIEAGNAIMAKLQQQGVNLK